MVGPKEPWRPCAGVSVEAEEEGMDVNYIADAGERLGVRWGAESVPFVGGLRGRQRAFAWRIACVKQRKEGANWAYRPAESSAMTR